MADDPYTYPGTDTLRNRLGITDDKTLTEAEIEGVIADYAHAARQAKAAGGAPEARHR